MNSEIMKNAYELEFQGLKLYEAIADKHEVFVQIYNVKKSGVELLRQCVNEDYNYECDIDKNDAFENFFSKALEYENKLCEFYQKATDDETLDETSRDLLFRLWATSTNEYQEAIKNIKQPNVFEEYTSNINNFMEDAKKIASGDFSKESLEKVMKNPNFSFFAGAAVGSMFAVVLEELIKKDKE